MFVVSLVVVYSEWTSYISGDVRHSVVRDESDHVGKGLIWGGRRGAGSGRAGQQV